MTIPQRIQFFFANPFICDWEGCNQLHEQYVSDISKIKGCTSCQMNGVKARYAKLITTKLNELSAKPADNK